MSWKYYKQEEKYELQYTNPLGKHINVIEIFTKTRSDLLNLYNVIGYGATDYHLFSFAYGCDLIYKIDKISENQFYQDEKYKWFFRQDRYHLKLSFKNENNSTIAKLLLDNHDNK